MLFYGVDFVRNERSAQSGADLEWNIEGGGYVPWVSINDQIDKFILKKSEDR